MRATRSSTDRLCHEPGRGVGAAAWGSNVISVFLKTKREAFFHIKINKMLPSPGARYLNLLLTLELYKSGAELYRGPTECAPTVC